MTFAGRLWHLDADCWGGVRGRGARGRNRAGARSHRKPAQAPRARGEAVDQVGTFQRGKYDRRVKKLPF